MTFFNNRQSTLDKLLTFPAFQSVESWLTGKKPILAMGASAASASPSALQADHPSPILPRYVAEEEDFSTHIFYHAPQITFFAWDAMLNGHFKTLSLSPRLTSFTGPGPLDPTRGLPQPSTNALFSPIPTTEGEVTLELGQTTEPVWMDLDKVVSFKSLVPGSDAVRRFYWRDGGGQVWERCEPWSWYDMQAGRQDGPLREGLYVHLQVRPAVRVPLYSPLSCSLTAACTRTLAQMEKRESTSSGSLSFTLSFRLIADSRLPSFVRRMVQGAPERAARRGPHPPHRRLGRSRDPPLVRRRDVRAVLEEQRA
jgi:hypothetical protein